MTTLRDRPAYRLTRHFFDGLFDLGFLSETGVASYKRLILGICTAFFSLGLLAARVLGVKYGELRAQDTPDEYRLALLGDHALLMAIPMWTVGFVTVLVGHALFPSALDLRVLMTLPVTRRLVFGTKIAAIVLFAGLFAVALHVATAPLFLIMTFGPWAEGSFLARVLAFGMSSLVASFFAAVFVMAVHGLLVLFAPSGRLMTASASLRSAMVCALVLALPFVLRLSTPRAGRGMLGGAWWVVLAPPTWFAGLERWLLGDGRPSMMALAQTAILALVATAVLTAAAYAVLYRHSDRLLLTPTAGGGWRGPQWLRRRRTGRPIFRAIRAFTMVTLRRSVLHQGIGVAFAAVGAGLVLNSLTEADLGTWLQQGGRPTNALVSSVVWSPFVLVFAMSLAIRASLMVPIELRANWVFRVTEIDSARLDQLTAATVVVGGLGVVAPVAVCLPLQWAVLGQATVPVALVTLLFGWLFVEILMRNWSRVPFTCSYLPGKGFVPQTILIGVFSFTTFTMLGLAFARATALGYPLAFVLDGFIVVLVFALRYRRRQSWADTPLEFEDSLPSEVTPLRLSAD